MMEMEVERKENNNNNNNNNNSSSSRNNRKSSSINAEESAKRREEKKLKRPRSCDFNTKMRIKRTLKDDDDDYARVKPDARSYLKFLTSRSTKVDLKGGGSGTTGVVEEIVAENCLSCAKKRKRVDSGFKSQCYSCIPKPSGELNSTSLFKVVCEQDCMAKSASKSDHTGDHTKDNFVVSKKEGGTESVYRLSAELSEDGNDVARAMESHLDGGCAICMLGGELLSCDGKGCQRRYHLSCLDPPLKHASFKVWHCILCVRKKMERGVLSVSKGVDSVWDVREVASIHEGEQKNKEYLVKYQGLAHVHNRWISESKLLLEAPKLVAKFKGRSQLTRWKTEWTVPQRLLQKRMLSIAKRPGDDMSGDSDCHFEWLVKWTGLNYDHATWELENTSCLTSSQAMELIKDYESRHNKAERLPSLSQVDEGGDHNLSSLYAYQPRKAKSSRLSELSSEDSPYNNYVNYVTKLREHWHKGENAIIIDDQLDQERIAKLILFILSLQHTVWRPFLIISSDSALPVWEGEFLRVAPSANFIVYKGSKDVRSCIRSLEFYNEGGNIMFQVLLTSSNIVIEELEMLKSITWRAVIIDEYHLSSISKHLKQFKMIAADRRLLVRNQIKDDSADYINVLSFLDSGVEDLKRNSFSLLSCTDIAILKERLAPYIAYECKPNSFRLVEYWVPVWLSNVQLEQYCSQLLSNPALFYSCSKNDNVDALREIIFSIKKCCDHPYLLDHSLDSIVRKDFPNEKNLDVDIQVSGKLLVLDKMLLKIKSRGLRALVIYQVIGGSRRHSIGNILEIFLQRRFGKDCYAHIDGGVYFDSKKQKQAALNIFNSKESGRFVFLIENHARLPSIKLSSVDSIILFDSDWDPYNDLKALQKITVNSQCEKVKVFRLYSCCTIEEMVLKLAKDAKEGATLESIDTTNRNTFHSLLSWGVPRLFSKLEEFHQHKTLASGSNIYSDCSFLDDLVSEFSTQLCSSSENDPESYSFISEAPQDAGKYSGHISLVGEKEIYLVDTEPSLFWKNQLDGRYPQWHFLSKSSSRIRKKVKYTDDFMKEAEIEIFDDVKKTQNVINRCSPRKKARLPRKRKLLVADKEHKISVDKSCNSHLVIDSSAVHPMVRDITKEPQVNVIELGKQSISPSVRKDIQSSLLKLEITQLCSALKLPENVKVTCVTLLEYVRKHFNVSWKTPCTLQAYQISLCWTAADLLKYKIDHKESLILAKLHLKFECKEGEANYIYSKLQDVKKDFGSHVEITELASESNHSKNSRAASSEQQDLEEEELTMDSESQSLSAELEILREREIPRIGSPASNSKSVGLDQQDLEGEVKGESQRLNVLDNLADLEEGEIPVCSNYTMFDLQDLEEGEIPVSQHSHEHLDQTMPETMEQKSVSKGPDDGHKDKMDDFSSQMDKSQKFETTSLTSRTMEDQLKDHHTAHLKKTMNDPVVSTGSPCLSDTKSEADTVQPTEISATSVCSQSGISDTKLPNHHETELIILETMEQNSASEGLDCLENKREDSNCHTEMSQKNPETQLVISRVVEEQMKDDDQISLLERTTKTSSSSPCLSDSMYKVGKMQHIDIPTPSVCSHSDIPSTKPSLPNNCETVLMVPQQTSDCSLNENEHCSLQAGAVTIVIESDTEIDNEEETVLKIRASTSCMHANEVCDSTQTLKDAAPGSISVERQSPNNNLQTNDPAVTPSKNPLSPFNEAAMVVEPVHCSTPPLHSLRRSVCMERVNVFEGRHEPTSVAPFSTEPPLEFTGTRPSVAQPHISAIHKNLVPVHQPPIPTITLNATAQEVPFSRQPMPNDSVEFANPSVDELPQPPSRSMQLGGNDSHIHEPRSRTNVQDFRSMHNVVESMHPLHTNQVMPESPQFAWFDPLQIEMQRIKKDHEQDVKMHEQTMLHIKSERDREIEEIIRKYDVLIQGAERALLQKRKDHRTNFQKVYSSKLLAEALKLKENGYNGAEAPDKSSAPASNIANELIQLSTHYRIQMSAMRLEQYPPIPLASSSVESINQPPLVLSNGSVRLRSNPMGGIMGEIQNGYELRAPAQLNASISQTLMPTQHLPVFNYGLQYQHNMPSSTMTPPTI